ncbi:MFS transporter [Jonesiaceae bacterium BS-20]|uniref:MFS transporter n=1 Tax=Jonesiaceae bacterium BS-20 TaxID=3120821 RepID=A0AAU7DV72_9MICO
MSRISTKTNRWLGLIAIALGVALIVVDTTIVNVITPSVIEDIGINSTQAQWIQGSYAIIFAALLLLVGRVSDLLGARAVFIWGVIGFGLTSLMAGLAQTGEILILARFLQGVTAALILPTSLALLNRMFTGKARGQAFAIWGSTIGGATALGPVIGGWFAENLTWRWAFGINIPFTIVILILAALFLVPTPRKRGSIDMFSAILSMLGLGLLAFGLIEGRTVGWVASEQAFELPGFTWDSGLSPAFVALILSVVLMTVFVWRQIIASCPSNSREPFMDTKLFSIASFRNGNIATTIIGLGEYGIIAVLPLWLVFAKDYTALQAGAALVPIAIGSFVASGISFPLMAKISPLGLVRTGLVLEVVGLAGLGVVAAFTNSEGWLISLVMFFYGIGVGFATSQVTNVVLADVPEEEDGQSSGIQSTFRQLGSALGIAALTTVFFSTLSSNIQTRLVDAGLSADQAAEFGDVVTESAGAAIHPLATNPDTAFIADAAREAMTHGLALGSYLAAGFLLLGVIATLLIPNTQKISLEPAKAFGSAA